MLGGVKCLVDHPGREQWVSRGGGRGSNSVQLYTWKLKNEEGTLKTWLRASSLNSGSWLCWNSTYLQSVALSFMFMFNTHKNNAESKKKKPKTL